MQVKDKKPAVLTLLILSFFLSGCWDHIDIEQRGYVLGVAIDAYPPVPMKDEEAAPGETPPEEEVKLELMETHTGQPLYAMTIQLPILRIIPSPLMQAAPAAVAEASAGKLPR